MTQNVSTTQLTTNPSHEVALSNYGRDGKSIVILLIGGDKRAQDRDIETAKEYWADYQARESEDDHGTS